MNNNIITKETVEYVAALSRLSFKSSEISKYQEQLGNILEYISQLNEVDTDNAEPTTHVLPDMKNVFREDIPKTFSDINQALENSPEKHDRFFKVPKVI